MPGRAVPGSIWRHTRCANPRHVQVSPVVPVIDNQGSVTINCSREHQLILGDDPLVQVRRVLRQSIKGRQLHNVAFPRDNSGGGDLRLPLPQEPRRDARVRRTGTAEGNAQTDPVLIRANLQLLIGNALPPVADQRPCRNSPLQIAYWFEFQPLQLNAERRIRYHGWECCVSSSHPDE